MTYDWWYIAADQRSVYRVSGFRITSNPETLCRRLCSHGNCTAPSAPVGLGKTGKAIFTGLSYQFGTSAVGRDLGISLCRMSVFV